MCLVSWSEPPVHQEEATLIDEEAKELNRQIGANVQAIRKFRGLSQKVVAKKIGITHQQVHKYETGDNGIPINRLVRLSQCLQVPVAAFFNGIFDERELLQGLLEDYTALVDALNKKLP